MNRAREVTVLTIIAQDGPSCIFQGKPKRKLHEKRKLSKVEQLHYDLKPYFKAPVNEEWRTPYGRTTTLEGLQNFFSRMDEITAIARSQYQELPSLAEEFRANGLSAISLSSSPQSNDDDDLEAANYAERNLGFVPYELDPLTLAPLLRRIEWEKYRLACGQASRIYAKVKDDGRITLASNDHRLKGESLKPYVKTIKRLVAGRTGEELLNDRARVEHYGAPVLASMTPEQHRVWRERQRRARAYLDFADDNRERENAVEEINDGPGATELGFHDPNQPSEPTEFDLWPITPEEEVVGIVPFELARSVSDQELSSFSLSV